VALFERNDLARAQKLALREASHSPHNVEAWFLSMETASAANSRAEELRDAVKVCRLAKPGDPRAAVAALRLSSFGQNPEMLRQQRDQIEAIASHEPACAGAALEALYQASLDGLPHADVRHLAQYSGWLTNYSMTRATGASRASEQFEFPDGRIVVPDYLPRAASYTATASYLADGDGDYEISGNLTGAKLTVDAQPTDPGRVTLIAGPHNVAVTFSAAETSPRIRITKTAAPTNPDWKPFNFAPREAIYLRAALALADGRLADAAQSIRGSVLANTTVGQKLVAEAAAKSAATAQASTSASTAACSIAVGERLQDCAPDSLAYANWLAAGNHDSDAVHELRRVLNDWPLDRAAHRMLISELQRVGDNYAADRAAADLLAIAPNARNFRRMARLAGNAGPSSEPFYQPYRRPAPAAVNTSISLPTSCNPEERRDEEPAVCPAPAVILLQDKVAIARNDGSVSLYMHRVVQLITAAAAKEFHPLAVPSSAQVLNSRVVNTGAAITAVQPGDIIDEEYVVNYTGDGGMISHPEAFQYVFNDFDFPLLDARFVVLSPATQSPGYVIASGNVPELRLDYANGLRAQIWENHLSVTEAANSDPAIIRVVENENGWSIPPSVERRRILETIHPGPRPREA
jgi:hypothetical protein